MNCPRAAATTTRTARRTISFGFHCSIQYLQKDGRPGDSHGDGIPPYPPDGGFARTVSALDVEIYPEPTEEERHAILLALRLEAADAAAASPWRRAGLEPTGPEDQAGAPLRQSRGAARA